MKFLQASNMLLVLTASLTEAFVPSTTQVRRSAATAAANTDDEFASFAATLEEDSKQSSSSTRSSRVSSSSSTTTDQKTWQVDLERLLDPTTPASQKQILFSNLMSANDEIRDSVQTALRDRKIDPLLTPTGRKIQDGTRAVARQLTNDILPGLAASGSSSSGTATTLPFPRPPLPPLPKPEDFSRLGNRVFNALNSQMQQNFETLQQDLADPTRIPQRISKQTEEILNEASNIFAETPAGLEEPIYTVVKECEDYEIRDYDAYTVATTEMEDVNSNNPAGQGVAFNTLASYIFGNNAQEKVMDMTTPVTTTMAGEMRFYISDINPPEPKSQDESSNMYDGNNKIRIETIPAARLAVRRFPGFATDGEIARQKEALLTALDLDDKIELDVAHGQTVRHIVFQYNPPYTLPVLRRNEIAVPVVKYDPNSDSEDAIEDAILSEDPWEVNTTNGESRP